MNTLEIIELSKNYPDFTLDKVSFSVPKGSITGFIGRNGAGKSTTLKAVLGLIKNDGGKVFFNGKDIFKSEDYFKENIGVVLGDKDFYPKKKIRTVTQVAKRFYKNFDEEKYRYYLNLFSINENKRIDELSSGMRVKYLIALALSHNAVLLIMDEPTSGLDPVSRDELTELFKAVVKDGNRSILFSTHITSDLQKCADRIAFIKEGKMQYQGQTDEFIKEYSEHGNTLEEIIVSVERKKYDESVII